MYEDIKNEKFIQDNLDDSIFSSGNSEYDMEKVINELQSQKKTNQENSGGFKNIINGIFGNLFG